MTAKQRMFIGLLALNTLIVILYLLWNWIKGRTGRKIEQEDRNKKPEEQNTGQEGKKGKPEEQNTTQEGKNKKPEERNTEQGDKKRKPEEQNTTQEGRNKKPKERNTEQEGKKRKPEERNTEQEGKKRKPEERNTGQEGKKGKPEDKNTEQENRKRKPEEWNTEQKDKNKEQEEQIQGTSDDSAKADTEKKEEKSADKAEEKSGTNKRNGVWLRAAVMFFCPVIGPGLFFFSHVLYKLFFSAPVDLEDVIFSKERVRTFLHADEDRERNIVPLEEAIEITDADELRNLMMNVVRGDISKSLASIALALNSEDTETAHYAASVLQDALNDFRFHVQKQSQMVLSEEEEDVNRVSYAEALIDYMNQVLEQKVFTDMEQKSYVDTMDKVCGVLYDKGRDHMTSAQYEAISLRLLEVEDYDNCRKWCDRAEYQYPNTLATYTCQLKLYFNSGQKDRFFEVMEALKHSAVVIDSETLELIRVFQK